MLSPPIWKCSLSRARFYKPLPAEHSAGCSPCKWRSGRSGGAQPHLGVPRPWAGSLQERLRHWIFFFFPFPRHPLIENDPMQLSARRPLVSTPWPVPSTEILAVMTVGTYTQEDNNNYLFAPDKKVLESAASGSWRLAVLLVTRDPHAPCSFTDGSKHQPA